MVRNDRCDATSTAPATLYGPPPMNSKIYFGKHPPKAAVGFVWNKINGGAYCYKPIGIAFL